MMTTETVEQGSQQQPTAPDLSNFSEYVKWREAGNEMPVAEEPKREADAVEQQPEQEKPRRDRTAEGRINELTAKLRTVEQERDEWKGKAGQERPVEKPADPPPPVGKPSFKAMVAAMKEGESYEDIQEKYQDALHDWREHQAAESAKQSKAAEKNQAETQAIGERLRKATAEKPDFADVVIHGQWMPKLLEAAVGQILRESDSLDVLYHLAKNPDDVARIASLPVTRQLIEIGKIEDRITKATEPEKPKAPPTSAAPPPPSRLGGSAPPEPDPMRAKTYDEYVKARGKPKN